MDASAPPRGAPDAPGASDAPGAPDGPGARPRERSTAAPGDELGPLAACVALVAILALLAFSWRALAGFPFTGEDYQILLRVGKGEDAYPHVFRPLPGLVLELLLRAFGAESARPYHAASLVLHGANALLLYLAVHALLRRRAPALLAAAVFAVGAAACDSIAWIAAVNRPLSAFGALVAWNGLVRWRAAPRVAPALLALGLVWQGLANEEVYGTAALALLWLAVEARPGRAGASASAGGGPSRGVALAAIGLVAGGVLLHYFALQRVPGGAEGVVAAGLSGAPARALQRSADVVRGYGVALGPDLAVGLLPPLAAVLFFFTGARRAAGFALFAWATSFIPFALDDAVEYRAYPTLAPTALLVAGLVYAAQRVLAPRHALPVYLIAAAVAVAGSHRPRRARIDAWVEGGREMSACAEALRALGAERPGELPALVNLETSTAGLFLYHYDAGVSALRSVDFLDGATGYVLAAELPRPPWFGRRFDGSYGLIDPAKYFAGRPALASVRLVGELVGSGSLAESRRLLGERGVDLERAAVAESEALVRAFRTGGAPLEASEVIELEPFDADPVAITARTVLSVRADADAVLALQAPWLYSHMMRISPDQMLFSDVKEARVLRLEAWIDGAAAPVEGFFLNAFGFGVPVPAGEHRVELRWRRATPAELR